MHEILIIMNRLLASPTFYQYNPHDFVYVIAERAASIIKNTRDVLLRGAEGPTKELT
jgi:hypothetical protein